MSFWDVGGKGLRRQKITATNFEGGYKYNIVNEGHRVHNRIRKPAIKEFRDEVDAEEDIRNDRPYRHILFMNLGGAHTAERVYWFRPQKNFF